MNKTDHYLQIIPLIEKIDKNDKNLIMYMGSFEFYERWKEREVGDVMPILKMNGMVNLLKMSERRLQKLVNEHPKDGSNNRRRIIKLNKLVEQCRGIAVKVGDIEEEFINYAGGIKPYEDNLFLELNYSIGENNRMHDNLYKAIGLILKNNKISVDWLCEKSEFYKEKLNSIEEAIMTKGKSIERHYAYNEFNENEIKELKLMDNVLGLSKKFNEMKYVWNGNFFVGKKNLYGLNNTMGDLGYHVGGSLLTAAFLSMLNVVLCGPDSLWSVETAINIEYAIIPISSLAPIERLQSNRRMPFPKNPISYMGNKMVEISEKVEKVVKYAH